MCNFFSSCGLSCYDNVELEERQMKQLTSIREMRYDIEAARLPVSYLHILALVVVIVLQVPTLMSYKQAAMLTLLGTLFIVVHWHYDRLTKKGASLYFFIQGVLCGSCAALAEHYTVLILMSFGLIMMIQLFYETTEPKLYALYVVIYFAVSTVLLGMKYRGEYLLFLLIMLFMMLVLVYLVLAIFHKKDVENKRLEEANRRIAQLTRQTERQRMARDLHDSLIQRLIGANLKLDVVEAHLKKGSYNKAENVVALAKEQVVQSIHEAREVVDDLRQTLHSLPFEDRFLEEVEQLGFLLTLPVTTRITIDAELPPEVEEHVLAIVKEALTNTHKHAEATAVTVSLQQQRTMYSLVIEDNGVGFQNEQHMAGHYGLIGMHERAAIIHGALHICAQNGVRIELQFPVQEGR